MLKAFLNSCQNIESLTLEKVQSRLNWSEVCVDLCHTIAHSFTFLPNLRTLNLSRNRFCDTNVSELTTALRAAPNLVELDLTAIALTGFGLRQFAEEYLAAEPVPKCLHKLDLTSNKFSDIEQAYHFSQAMS